MLLHSDKETYCYWKLRSSGGGLLRTQPRHVCESQLTQPRHGGRLPCPTPHVRTELGGPYGFAQSSSSKTCDGMPTSAAATPLSWEGLAPTDSADTGSGVMPTAGAGRLQIGRRMGLGQEREWLLLDSARKSPETSQNAVSRTVCQLFVGF